MAPVLVPVGLEEDRARGLEAGTFEYRARNASESENLDRDTLLKKLGG